METSGSAPGPAAPIDSGGTQRGFSDISKLNLGSLLKVKQQPIRYGKRKPNKRLVRKLMQKRFEHGK